MILFSLSFKASFVCVFRAFFASRLIPGVAFIYIHPHLQSRPSLSLGAQTAQRALGGGEFVFASSAPRRRASPKLHLPSFNHSISHLADIRNQRRDDDPSRYATAPGEIFFFRVVLLKGKSGPIEAKWPKREAKLAPPEWALFRNSLLSLRRCE